MPLGAFWADAKATPASSAAVPSNSFFLIECSFVRSTAFRNPVLSFPLGKQARYSSVPASGPICLMNDVDVIGMVVSMFVHNQCSTHDLRFQVPYLRPTHGRS